MRELNIKEVKEIQLDILRKLHVYCNEHNINYYLTGGTLIGAIRHKGYIPWDDDIDVMLLRKDYEKLLNTFQVEDKKIKIISPYSDANYGYPFAKMYRTDTVYKENTEHVMENIGIYIDIFPIDKVPESTKKLNMVFSKIKFYKQLIRFKSIEEKDRGIIKNFLVSILKIGMRFINLNSVACKMNEIAMNAEKKDSGYLGDLVWGYGLCEIVKSSVFDNKLLCEFEEEQFYIPSGYDEWLTSVYGKYMELPPEDKRIPHHGFKAYSLKN